MSTTATATATAEATSVKLTAAYDADYHKQVSQNNVQDPRPIRTNVSLQYKYTDYLPVYDEETSFPPLQPFEFNDRGLVADKKHRNLFSDEKNLNVTKLTPVIGTEIRGLQLSELDDRQKDELAHLIAERGVVVFRDQNFKDIGVEKQKEFAQYFGPLHIHVSRRLSSRVSGSGHETRNILTRCSPSVPT